MASDARLIGLLSWYDERPEELIAAIVSMAEAGVEHLVAVDGAYALYPNAKGPSPADQHAAIHLACTHQKLALTMHVPWVPWRRNEREKRTALFALAWSVARRGDWFLVIDADEIVTKHPSDLRERLAASERDVAIVCAIDQGALQANDPNWPPYFSVRKLFRAQPIRVEGNHFTYVTEDDRTLWAGGDTIDGEYGKGWRLSSDELAEPCVDLLDDFEILHRPGRRDPMRQLDKQTYYHGRDATGEELRECGCGRPAAKVVTAGWKWNEGAPVALHEQRCAFCAPRVERRGRKQLRRLLERHRPDLVAAMDSEGVKIDDIPVLARQGRAPDVLLG